MNYEGFNGIGDYGATSLARSLMRNRSLRTLYLSGNSIGAAGATALAESLGRVNGLETLHLSVSGYSIYSPFTSYCVFLLNTV